MLDTVGLHRLLDALRALGIGAEHFPWPPPGDPDRAPYRGWAPLEEADAAVFFGRDAQIVRGLDVLHGMRTSGFESLFVILGPSGAGKSSFLRAGLLPRLRRDDRRFLPLPIVRPERAVLTGELGLANAIHRLRTGLGLRQPMLGEIKTPATPSMLSGCGAGWRRPGRPRAPGCWTWPPSSPPPPWCCRWIRPRNCSTPTPDPKPHVSWSYWPRWCEHEAGVTPGLIVALTIRADRYEPLQIAPELAGVHGVVFDELKPMPPAGYKDVITGPARRATAAGRQLSIEAALVERLLAETAEGADALPLLALSLERLYHDFGDDGDLTVAEYESMGGMAQVVQTEVDKLLAADPERRQAQLDVLHDAFIPWLATIHPDNDQPMRRLARWEDLFTASHPLIDAFVEKRLLVKDTRNGQTVVEVALESLLRQWRELAAWLRDEAQDLKDADSLERAAADWQASGRNESWLLEGTRLAEAETLAARPGFRDRLDPIRDFLHASRTRENDRIEAERQRQQAELQAAQRHAASLRKRARTLRAVLALTLVVALVAVGGLVYAVKKGKEANARSREALAEQLTSQAQSILVGGQPGTALEPVTKLLAAQRISPNSDTGAMLTALNRTAKLRRIVQAPNGRFLSGDGSRVAVTTDSGAQVLDTETGNPVGKPFADPGDALYGRSLDGRYLAMVGAMFLSNPRRAVGKISVPTMYVWSDDDIALTEKPPLDTAAYVTGEYRFEILHGSHWIPDEQPDKAADLLLEWFETHPV